MPCEFVVPRLLSLHFSDIIYSWAGLLTQKGHGEVSLSLFPAFICIVGPLADLSNLPQCHTTKRIKILTPTYQILPELFAQKKDITRT